jgi:hypothetical protein
MPEEILEQNIEQLEHVEEVHQEIDNFDDVDLVVQALEEKKLNFSKVPREKRDTIKKFVVNKALEEAEENGDDEKAFALRNGWSPETLYGGKNKDGSARPFKDYKEFNATIRENSPVLNERLKTLAKEMEEMKRENQKLMQISKMTFERSLKSDEQSLDAQIKEAREYGDFDRYDSLIAKKQELQSNTLRLKEYEPEPAPVQTEVQPEVKEWGARNQWFWSDNQMKQFAIAQEDILRNTRPELNLSERLELITKSAEISFPDRFAPKVTKPAVLPARTAGNFSANKKVEVGFSSLPDIEKTQARQMIRQGVFKDESDFMKSYNKLK